MVTAMLEGFVMAKKPSYLKTFYLLSMSTRTGGFIDATKFLPKE